MNQTVDLLAEVVAVSNISMDLSKKISFKSNILPYVIDDDKVLLLSESEDKFLIRGKIYASLVPLLNGQNTIDEIIENFSPEFPAENICFAVLNLNKKGFLSNLVESFTNEQCAFWENLNCKMQEVAQRLKDFTVGIKCVGNVASDYGRLSDALSSIDIKVVSQSNNSLTIVLVTDYLDVELEEINKQMLVNSESWIIAKVVGKIIWLGPFFGPNANFCWKCLSGRLKENRFEEMVVQGERHFHPVLSVGVIETSRQIGINLLATEVAKWIAATGKCVLTDSILTLDIESLETDKHSVKNLIHCKECGGNRVSENQPEVKLFSKLIKYSHDGGLRVCHPDETYLRLKPLTSPITGITSNLSKILSSSDVHVYQIKQNSPVGVYGWNKSKLGQRNGAAGKGESNAQAKVSCLAEAIERYSCVYQGNENRIKALLCDLHDDAIHPNALLNFSERQYEIREDWNKNNPGFNWIPHRFDETKETEWTPNWSLTNSKIRYLPTAYCYFDYNLQDHLPFCKGDSNGCASGNNLEEAILQGLLELIERDSMAIFWYNRVRRPQIDLHSFDNSYFTTMLQYYKTIDRNIIIIDITTDLKIPTVAALSWTSEGKRILIGLGAHLNIQLAISRAISELNQMLPVASFWEKRIPVEHLNPVDDQHLSQWMDDVSIYNNSYFVPIEGEFLYCRDFNSVKFDDLLSGINFCVQLLKEKGLEVIVLDLTRPETDFPTVRVTVPGLRHFWARHGPGRLYDVPVKLGWLKHKKQEGELNPIACFL